MFKIEDACKRVNISRTIGFAEEIFEKLSAVSRKNDVSFNFLVVQCCKYALENLKEDQKP